MNRLSGFLVILVLILVAPLTARAGQCPGPMHPDDEARMDAEMVSRAEMVFIGRVVGQNLDPHNPPPNIRRTVTFEVLSAEKGQLTGDVRLWFYEFERELSFPSWRFQLGDTYRIFVHRMRGGDALYFTIGCGPSGPVADPSASSEVRGGGCASCSVGSASGMPNLGFALIAFLAMMLRRRGAR